MLRRENQPILGKTKDGVVLDPEVNSLRSDSVKDLFLDVHTNHL